MEISQGRAPLLCCVVGVSEGKPGDSDLADDGGDLYRRTRAYFTTRRNKNINNNHL
jgi:hypothetical protein